MSLLGLGLQKWLAKGSAPGLAYISSQVGDESFVFTPRTDHKPVFFGEVAISNLLSNTVSVWSHADVTIFGVLTQTKNPKFFGCFSKYLSETTLV